MLLSMLMSISINKQQEFEMNHNQYQLTYMPVRCQLSVQLLEKILNCVKFVRFETRYRSVPN
jgi:uncharacterized membrane protein